MSYRAQRRYFSNETYSRRYRYHHDSNYYVRRTTQSTPLRRRSDEIRQREAEEEKRRTANDLKHKLQALTKEDKDKSMRALLNNENHSDETSADKEMKRIAHVRKPIKAPPPTSVTPRTKPINYNYSDVNPTIAQENIKKQLLKDLLKLPVNDLKDIVSKSRCQGYNLCLSLLQKECRNSLSETLRKVAEHKLFDNGLNTNGPMLTELENLVDSDLAVDVFSMPAETIQVLGQILNLDLDSDMMLTAASNSGPSSEPSSETPLAFDLSNLKKDPDAANALPQDNASIAPSEKFNETNVTASTASSNLKDEEKLASKIDVVPPISIKTEKVDETDKNIENQPKSTSFRVEESTSGVVKPTDVAPRPSTTDNPTTANFSQPSCPTQSSFNTGNQPSSNCESASFGPSYIPLDSKRSERLPSTESSQGERKRNDEITNDGACVNSVTQEESRNDEVISGKKKLKNKCSDAEPETTTKKKEKKKKKETPVECEDSNSTAVRSKKKSKRSNEQLNTKSLNGELVSSSFVLPTAESRQKGKKKTKSSSGEPNNNTSPMTETKKKKTKRSHEELSEASTMADNSKKKKRSDESTEKKPDLEADFNAIESEKPRKKKEKKNKGVQANFTVLVADKCTQVDTSEVDITKDFNTFIGEIEALGEGSTLRRKLAKYAVFSLKSLFDNFLKPEPQSSKISPGENFTQQNEEVEKPKIRCRKMSPEPTPSLNSDFTTDNNCEQFPADDPPQLMSLTPDFTMPVGGSVSPDEQFYNRHENFGKRPPFWRNRGNHNPQSWRGNKKRGQHIRWNELT